MRIQGFLSSLVRMKSIPRSGWLSYGVSLQDVESIADHSFSTCVLSSLLADLEVRRGIRVNVERVFRLAVFHDMSESLTFDISKRYLDYLGKRGESIKNELERAAWKHVAKSIEDPQIARDYRLLYTEYSASKTIESKIVHGADGLDILLQIIDYCRRGYPPSLLSELWSSTSARISKLKLPSVKKLCDLLRKDAKKLGLQASTR